MRESRDREITSYFDSITNAQLEEGTEQSADPALYRPTSNAQTYLQFLYTVPAKGNFDDSVKITNAGDPST